jgi:hypothetical protein
MVKHRIVDAFETKKSAQEYATTLKMLGVQFVIIRRVNFDSGRLKYGVYVAGTNSWMYG